MNHGDSIQCFFLIAVLLLIENEKLKIENFGSLTLRIVFLGQRQFPNRPYTSCKIGRIIGARRVLWAMSFEISSLMRFLMMPHS